MYHFYFKAYLHLIRIYMSLLRERTTLNNFFLLLTMCKEFVHSYNFSFLFHKTFIVTMCLKPWKLRVAQGPLQGLCRKFFSFLTLVYSPSPLALSSSGFSGHMNKLQKVSFSIPDVCTPNLPWREIRIACKIKISVCLDSLPR